MEDDAFLADSDDDVSSDQEQIVHALDLSLYFASVARSNDESGFRIYALFILFLSASLFFFRNS